MSSHDISWVESHQASATPALVIAQASDLVLQVSDSQFTGCVCVMALINIPDLQATFQSVRRILKPGGWLVFAIPHPCFETPHAQWTSLPDPEHTLGRSVTGYF